MTATTKLTHIMKPTARRDFAVIAFCGRRVGLLSTVHVENGEEATCPKCQRAAGVRA